MRNLRQVRRSLLQSASQPVLEQLEHRRLLSVSVANGIATITGTDAADTISIAVDPTDATQYLVTDNGAPTTIAQDQVIRFEVTTLAGDDTVTVDRTNGAVDAPRLIDGGDGNDTLAGSAGVDTLRGSAGDDSLTGGSGADLLVGGTGNDTLKGGGGSDTLKGNADNDSLLGNNGNDDLRGNVGDDSLYGAAGDDTLKGGDGNDVLGGDDENILPTTTNPTPPTTEGNDSMNGGTGNDSLLAHTGIDTLTGGGGFDLLDARNPLDELTDVSRVADTIPSDNVFNATTDPAQTTTTAQLGISIDSTGTPDAVVIPSGAGSFPTGTSIATAGDNGQITFQSPNPGETFTLAQFFQQWGFTFNANQIGRFKTDPTHTLTMTVNGVPNTDFQNHVITNGDVIAITYAPIA